MGACMRGETENWRNTHAHTAQSSRRLDEEPLFNTSTHLVNRLINFLAHLTIWLIEDFVHFAQIQNACKWAQKALDFGIFACAALCGLR